MKEACDRYVYIYEDIGGTPFYVGVGKGNRIDQHVSRATALLRQSPNSAKAIYIMDCIKRGFPPQAYKCAENLTIAEAMKIEIDLIKTIGRMDLNAGPLLNACDGGHGIKNFSPETRARIAARTREAMQSLEVRARLSISAKAKMARPGQRAKVAAATRALWQKDDFRQKFFANSKSKWTPEARAKQAERTRLSAKRKREITREVEAQA